MSSRIVKESLCREQAAREALEQTIAREEALRHSLEKTASLAELDIQEVRDAGEHFAVAEGRTWCLKCPAKWKSSWKFSFVLSPRVDGREIYDSHHAGGVHYLPTQRQIVVMRRPWGGSCEGLPCASGHPEQVCYDVGGDRGASYRAPTDSGVMFAVEGSKLAVVGEDGTFHVGRPGEAPHSVCLPDLGGKVSHGCSREPGTSSVFLSVGSKVHLVDYDARTITRTWDLPGPVLQLASGPRGTAFALIKGTLFTLSEEGCAFVRDRVQGIFSCPVSGRLYVSC